MQQNGEGLTKQEKIIFACLGILLCIVSACVFVVFFSKNDRNNNKTLQKEQSSDVHTSIVAIASKAKIATSTTKEFVVNFDSPEDIYISLEKGSYVYVEPSIFLPDGSHQEALIRIWYESDYNTFTMLPTTNNRFAGKEGKYRIRYTSQGKDKVIILTIVYPKEETVVNDKVNVNEKDKNNYSEQQKKYFYLFPLSAQHLLYLKNTAILKEQKGLVCDTKKYKLTKSELVKKYLYIPFLSKSYNR